MANVAIFNEGATPENVLRYLLSVNTPDYESRTDVVINPSIPSGVPIKYLKHEAGNIVEMTQGEKDALDAAETAAIILQAKTEAKAIQDQLDSQARILRAIVKLTVDQLNIIRTWERDFQAVVAAASNLSDIKTGVASLSSLSDITYTQAKTSIDGLIDGE